VRQMILFVVHVLRDRAAPLWTGIAANFSF
jgi:hypothetical protein